PELLDKRPEWGSGRRNFTSLYLEPLPGPVMRELLAGLVPGLPESAVTAVIGRAEGIPLYAVETVRMLVADGKVVAAGDGTYRPVGDLSLLAIPETLTALIAARLDALDPADRSLVMDAAVLGQSFTVAGLAAVSGIDEGELGTRLRALVRRELFGHTTDPTSPERGQHAFVQALIREVAYNTLARKDRKVRHLAAARFFESLGNDELAGGLAGHYLAARENAGEGAEADALGAQARIALRGAAERAASLGGFDQALTFFEQALGVAGDPGDRAELSQRAGEVASTAGRHDASERHLRAAVELHRERNDRPATARAVAALGRALNMAYRIEDAIALLEPAATEFAELAPHVALVAIGGQLARAHFLLDHHQRAIEVADQVLLAAERGDLKDLVADTLVTKGTALALTGRPIEGLGVLRAGMEVAEDGGLVETVLRAANNRAVFDTPRNPRAGLTNSRKALALARQFGARSWIATLVQGVV
ncbi:MAG: hypothetical protein H0V73_07115, partial [Chloroflexi bacterium]|nr:hypothetical protein [Chloroflexota bacterium]